MNNRIELTLKALRDFQVKYPESHVGGSIGLMLHGVDLKRDLGLSDLDITVPHEIDVASLEATSCRSDAGDFDYALMVDCKKYSQYVKMDIRMCPEPSFEIVYYGDHSYNVSRMRDIMFWKRKYAAKGVIKHINDITAIETGIRPVEGVSYSINSDDSLPF